MSSALKKYAYKNEGLPNTINKRQRNSSKSREQSIMTKFRKKTIPSQSDTITEQGTLSNNHYSRRRMNSLPISLPKLTEQIVKKQKQAINHIYRRKMDSKKHYQLHPLRKYQPIRLMKRPSSSSSHVSYLSMASSRAKITDQYFSQMDNIRMVEKLLLAAPTKQTSKNEHKEFFKRQEKYRRNIQLSKAQFLSTKKSKFVNKPWNT